jgi:predicted RNA-binding Zn-ribbon protein involved in translation (DUF1610 family)
MEGIVPLTISPAEEIITFKCPICGSKEAWSRKLGLSDVPYLRIGTFHCKYCLWNSVMGPLRFAVAKALYDNRVCDL